MSVLRAAVIGVGNMGYHHARVLSRLEDVSLEAVVDPDVVRAADVAERFGGVALARVEQLPEIDLAVVATPTHVHVPVALELIARGISVLVEKPFAPTAADARLMVDAARSAGVVIAAGHIERFNPVIRMLAALAESPLMMQFERLSPFTPRISESVVFDLMVHDLDLACMFAAEKPVEVHAVGVHAFSESADAASALLRFPGGCIASLQSSRVTQDKVRRVSISEADRFLFGDCLQQDVSIKRETKVSYADDATFHQVSSIERPSIDRRIEPLHSELADFVRAVRGDGDPQVDGEAGLAAVELAQQVEAALSDNSEG